MINGVLHVPRIYTVFIQLCWHPGIMHSSRPATWATLGCCCCHAAAAFAAMGSPGTCTTSDLAALQQWQHTIEAAEQQWGPSHPAVGRAWLELARALQVNWQQRLPMLHSHACTPGLALAVHNSQRS